MASDRHTLADDISLVESLRFAVPIHLAALLARPERERARIAQWWASDGAGAVGERGDLLQFVKPRATTNLKTANTFDQFARGLAALVVLTPGGVNVAGLHWCLNPDCQPCNPPHTTPTQTLAEINAQLEALDADYRRLCGLPPWVPPAPKPAPPTEVTPLPRRPITDVHLPEAA